MKKLSNNFKKACRKVYKKKEDADFNKRVKDTEKSLNKSVETCDRTIDIMRNWLIKNDALTEELELELFALKFGTNDARLK